MTVACAKRMSNVPKSFIREILKVTQDPQMISFAGGLPNPRYFPSAEIAQAAAEVLGRPGDCGLQYATTEGYPPLREYIARQYREKMGLDVSADEILITNGSQQGLDLVGKVFIDASDAVIIEQPAYLGAIQAFSAYEPQFNAVPLMEDGIDLDRLADVLKMRPAKLFHTVINFQNPSGITYSTEKRRQLAELIGRHDVLLVEDDPYGQLRFGGTRPPSMQTWLGEKAVTLGSFSKTVAPGMRMGWICARKPVMDKLVVAKQATDLHSNYLVQRILYQYLASHDLDKHVATICAAYKKQKDAMVAAVEAHFPPQVRITRPEGGMFLWATLPETLFAGDLFEQAIAEKVAFVPGMPFFVNGGGHHNMRLNFSNADANNIEEGIRRLGKVMKQSLKGKG
jgi:2-aminoadipate transaminase